MSDLDQYRSSILLKIDSDTSNAVLNGYTTDDFSVNFPSGIALGDPSQWEMALVRCVFTNAVFNISASKNNNTLTYYGMTIANLSTTVLPSVGVTNYSRSVTIPDGNYTIQEINSLLTFTQTSHGDVMGGNPMFQLSINNNTLKTQVSFNPLITLSSNPNAVYLDFTSNNQQLGNLLGFGTRSNYSGFSGKYYSVSSIQGGLQSSVNVANMTNSIVSADIRCSLVTNSYDSYIPSTILYSFPITALSGNFQVVEPYRKIYLPLNIQSTIYFLRMQLTDQLGRQLYVQNQNVSYLLHLRKKGYYGDN
jgi:hypothetical protein